MGLIHQYADVDEGVVAILRTRLDDLDAYVCQIAALAG